MSLGELFDYSHGIVCHKLVKVLIIALGSSEFFVGFYDAWQVGLLEKQKELTSVVF